MKHIIRVIVALWLPWLAVYFPLCFIIFLFSADTVEFREVVSNPIGLFVAVVSYLFLYIPGLGFVVEALEDEL